MPTPQEQYDEAKVRLDNNIKRLELLNTEIQQKEQENQEAIKIVQEIQALKQEANFLMQPILEDQGAVKVLANIDVDHGFSVRDQMKQFFIEQAREKTLNGGRFTSVHDKPSTEEASETTETERQEESNQTESTPTEDSEETPETTTENSPDGDGTTTESNDG